ncbi:MAG: aminotransferase class IV [Planctomycetota bacterium]
MPSVWLDGGLVSEDDARIDPRDGGFLHAAGVFTTMRASGGRVLMLDAHLARLRQSCEALYVPLTFKDNELSKAATLLLEANGLSDARLRLTVTRGRTERDPLHGEVHRPTVMLTAGEMTPVPAEYRDKGMTAVLNSEHKLNPYDLQAGHKTLDYFGRFAALREAARRGAGESLWFDVHNFLQCGSIANVFIVEQGTLVTPPTNEDLKDEAVKRSCPYPKSSVLPGTVRAWVMEQEGVGKVQRLPIDVNRLLAADEVFVTNSIMGVVPVTRLEQKEIGDGQPGGVTRQLMLAFDTFSSQS